MGATSSICGKRFDWFEKSVIYNSFGVLKIEVFCEGEYCAPAVATPSVMLEAFLISG